MTVGFFCVPEKEEVEVEGELSEEEEGTYQSENQTSDKQ